MADPKKFSFYNPKRKRVTLPVSGEPSRVKQEFVKDSNINVIFARLKNGISPPAWMTSKTPHFGDFTNPLDFQKAFDLVENAHEAFMSLPVEFRREIDHDPRKLASAPRELFERFGLLKESASPKSGIPGAQPLPSGNPDGVGSGAAPKASKKPSKEPSGDSET